MLCCELDSSASQEKTGPTHLFSSRWPVRLGEWCQGQGWPGHQATLGGTVPLRRARCQLASLKALLIFAESGVPVSNCAEMVSDARGDGLRNEATSARWSHTCWGPECSPAGCLVLTTLLKLCIPDGRRSARQSPAFSGVPGPLQPGLPHLVTHRGRRICTGRSPAFPSMAGFQSWRFQVTAVSPPQVPSSCRASRMCVQHRPARPSPV